MITVPFKRIVRYFVGRILYSSGMLEMLLRINCRNKAFILMYHRVLPSIHMGGGLVEPGMYVTPASLEMHIMLLQKMFTIIPLHELIARIQSRQEIGRCCSLTFDDGWKDNFDYAYPILKRHEVPATIFVTTGLLGTNKWFWPDEVSFLLMNTLENIPITQDIDPHLGEAIEKFMRGLSQEKVLSDIIFRMKAMCPEDRDRTLIHLRKICHGQPSERALLSWDEVHEMFDSRLIAFGSHTVNHTLLDQVAPDIMHREISVSGLMLRRDLGAADLVFAYPNGNYTHDVATAVQDNGYVGAVTTVRGFVGKKVDLFQLPRIGMHEDISSSAASFLFRLLTGR